MVYSVYCSGSIAKGAADEKTCYWSDEERFQVRRGADPEEVVFLNPDDPITDPTNVLGQFGRDMYQVSLASAVIVDARERRGLGIGVEMAAAATLGTPIIVVAPRNSKYRCDTLKYRGTTVTDYIHPHVASLAVAVVEDFTDAGAWLSKIDGMHRSKNQPPQWLVAAVEEYRSSMLGADTPMLEALEKLDVDLAGIVSR